MKGKLWWAYLAVGMVGAAVYFAVPSGVPQDSVYLAVGLSAVAVIVYSTVANRLPCASAWYLLAAGVLLLALGHGGIHAPGADGLDLLALAGYPVIGAGILLLVRSREPAPDAANVIDSMVIVTGVAVVSTAYLITPYTSGHEDSVSTMLVSVAYPLADLLLLTMAARLMFSPGGRPPAYIMLLGAIALLFTADTLHSLGVLNGTYEPGSPVDADWLAAFVVMGAAALHPSAREVSKPIHDRGVWANRRRFVILAGATLIPPIVGILDAFSRGVNVPVWTTLVPTVILFCLVLTRAWGLVDMLSAALRKHEEAELLRRRSEERFGSLVQHASDLVTVADESGVITYQSTSVERLLGYGREELLGHAITDYVHPDDREDVRAVLAQAMHANGGQPARMSYRMRHRDATWRDVETTLSNLVADPTVGGIVLNTRDVTDRTALQNQLVHQAFHDPLTDLANRELFRDRVDHALKRRGKGAEPIAVLFLDVDDFKNVNDSLGHAAGDELLRELAERIRTCLRAGDTAARLGGDEFAILLEDTNDANPVAERIGAALRRPFTLEDKEVFVTVSIGIGVGKPAQGSAGELLRNADAAMYAAKSRGKARSVVFHPDMHVRAMRRLDLEAELRRAIDREEFRLHYQPIVKLRSGRIAGIEALVRWQHPSRGLIWPSEFIGLAEETGLIRPISRWVLEEATRQARIWQTRHPMGLRLTMSVNLSADRISDPEIVGEVETALSKSGLNPQDLTLEVTEHLIMRDTELAVRKLQELKSIGVRLSIDDFGTGFSSLSYLRNFPIDQLKIAKPFLDAVPHGRQETALVRGIAELGRNLNLSVVAEGVERPEQLAALMDMRCDLAQGFLIARPQSAERVEQLLGHASAVGGKLRVPTTRNGRTPAVSGNGTHGGRRRGVTSAG